MNLVLRSAARACLVTLVSILPAARCAAQQEQSWEAVARQVRQEVVRQAVARVKEEVTPEKVAGMMDMEWPVDPPTQRRSEVKTQAQAVGEADAAARFPPLDQDALRREAVARYPMYKVGETIEITVRRGRGARATVSGRLHEVGPWGVRIGYSRVGRIDLDTPQLAAFYEDENRKAVEAYVADALQQHAAQREAHAREVAREKLPELYEAAGYVRRQNRWVARREVLEDAARAVRRRRLRAVVAELEPQAMQARGFVRHQGRWVPGPDFAAGGSRTIPPIERPTPPDGNAPAPDAP